MVEKMNFFIALVAFLLTVVGAVLIFNDIQNSLLLFLAAIAVGAVNVYSTHHKQKKLEKVKKLAEKLFLLNIGKRADRVELILRPTPTYDRLNQGFSDKTTQVKFWLEDEISKGIVDIKYEVLYMKEPVILPVYAGELIPVWKEVTKMHKNGMPKKVEFYDSTELPHRMDYLDEKGDLKKGSWRRAEGIVEYWNPKAQVWEPIP